MLHIYLQLEKGLSQLSINDPAIYDVRNTMKFVLQRLSEEDRRGLANRELPIKYSTQKSLSEID